MKKSPSPQQKSPTKSPSKKRCSTRCVQHTAELEKGNNTLKQKVQTLETHQETLRSTIASKDALLKTQTKLLEDLQTKLDSQKKLIHDLEIEKHTHENVAVQFMGMVVDDERKDDSFAGNDGEMSNQESNLHTKLKELYRMKQDLEQALVKAITEIESEQNKFSELDSTYQDVRKNLEDCDKNLKSAQETISIKVKENAGLVKQLAKSEQLALEHMNHVYRLKEASTLDQEEIKKLSDDNQQLVGRAKSLEGSYNDVCQQIDTLKD